MSAGTRKVCGTVVGTGSAIDVKTVGFRPRSVCLRNTSGNCVGNWQHTMPDAAMQKIVDSGSGTTDISYVTSNGVTPLNNGFTIGADGDLNASTEVIHWEACD
jgi:hypothetical protein